MSSQRWDPMREIVTLRDAMNSMLEDSFVRPRAGMTAMTSGMAMDLKETDDTFILEIVLPGVKPENVDISVLNDTLRVKAESTDEGEREGENWLLRERRHGRFERSITLPAPVKADDASAGFENGILRIVLPKSEGQRPKTIQVRSAHELTEANEASGAGHETVDVSPHSGT
jgi:HSP20 family protein